MAEQFFDYLREQCCRLVGGLALSISMIVVGTQYVNETDACPYSQAPLYLQVVGSVNLVISVLGACISLTGNKLRIAVRFVNLGFTISQAIWGAIGVFGMQYLL